MSGTFYYIAISLIAAGLGYLTYHLFHPFLSSLSWAAVLSLVFYPLYSLIKSRVRSESLASSITLLIIVLIIVGPFSYIIFMLVQELTSLANKIKEGEIVSLQDIINHPKVYGIYLKVLSKFNLSAVDIEKKLMDGIAGLGGSIISNITKSIGNVLGIIVDFVIMIFSIFFMLRDGQAFISGFQEFMPFSQEQKNRLSSQVRDVVVSTVYGGITVALAQGIVAGTTMALLGFSSPVLWGAATAIISFVPLLGAAGVWAPAAGYLFLQGSIAKGVILVLVGFFGISMIDNILKPIIIGSRTKLPVIVIFFSVLGGLQVFGLIGLIAGPLVVALFFSVIQIFKDIGRDLKEPST